MFVLIGELYVNPANVTYVREESSRDWSGKAVTLHFVSGEFIHLSEEWTILSVISILEKEF